LAGEHADAAEMIFMDQLPEVDHFTPVMLGDRSYRNAWNSFSAKDHPLFLSTVRSGKASGNVTCSPV
jgi:hypothetical protein